MERFFNMDNKFFAFMGRVGDLMILNILWLLCSLPLVTMGASTAALYYATLKMARNEDSYPARMFLHSFRQNLRQGICLTLIFLVLGALLFVDIRVCLSMNNQMGKLLTAVFFLLTCLFGMTLSYTFPVLAQFENSLKAILKNALLMSICHLPLTVVIVALDLVPVLLFFISPYYFVLSFPAWLLLGFALIAWINGKLFVKVFARYIPEEETGENEDLEEL